MATLVDKYFSQADFDAIETSVRKAEQQSSGEIVVLLTSQSKQWQIERLIHSSLAAVIAMLAALYFTRENNWGIYYNTTQALLWGGIGTSRKASKNSLEPGLATFPPDSGIASPDRRPDFSLSRRRASRDCRRQGNRLQSS